MSNQYDLILLSWDLTVAGFCFLCIKGCRCKFLTRFFSAVVWSKIEGPRIQWKAIPRWIICWNIDLKKGTCSAAKTLAFEGPLDCEMTCQLKKTQKTSMQGSYKRPPTHSRLHFMRWKQRKVLRFKHMKLHFQVFLVVSNINMDVPLLETCRLKQADRLLGLHFGDHQLISRISRNEASRIVAFILERNSVDKVHQGKTFGRPGKKKKPWL